MPAILRKTTLLCFYLLIFSCIRAQTCDCKKGEGHEDYVSLCSIGKGKHRITVCGLEREGAPNEEDSTFSDPSWRYHLHSALIVYDCKTGDTLFEQEMMMDSWMYNLSISTNKDQIELTEMTFIDYLGAQSTYTPLPVATTCFSIRHGKAFVSKPQPAFTMPPFSQAMRDSARRFYNRLEDTLKVKPFAQWIDYNQYPGDLLLTAALLDMGRSRYLYRHLREYFDLDGAVSEDYEQGYLDHLLDNIKK